MTYLTTSQHICIIACSYSYTCSWHLTNKTLIIFLNNKKKNNNNNNNKTCQSTDPRLKHMKKQAKQRLNMGKKASKKTKKK